MDDAERRAVFVGPSEGEATGFRRRLIAKLRADDVADAIFVMESRVAPGDIVAPHTHIHEDECAYVVSGQLRFEVGPRIFDAPAGSYVVKPRGVSHAFYNPGPEHAHTIEIHTPGGIDRYYAEMDAVWADATLDEAAKLAASADVQARHGILYAPDGLTAFKRRLGL